MGVAVGAVVADEPSHRCQMIPTVDSQLHQSNTRHRSKVTATLERTPFGLSYLRLDVEMRCTA
jgi:hypothetical protein